MDVIFDKLLIIALLLVIIQLKEARAMISLFDLFSIGVGPSSSHTVGPMRAGYYFSEQLNNFQLLSKTNMLRVEIFGSLAYTGVGHGTDKALLMGLENDLPESIDPYTIETRYQRVKEAKQLNLGGQYPIHYDYDKHFIFNYEDLLPRHTNGIQLTALDDKQQIVLQKDYYSIGGGFVITDDSELSDEHTGGNEVPYPFDNAEQLINHCHQADKSIAEIMYANELAQRSEQAINQNLDQIINVMFNSIDRGCQTEGYLPGSIQVKRRAKQLADELSARGEERSYEYVDSLDWLNAYAIAVNEENAAGGRIVTAPTNGAAGVIPAVMKYYQSFYPSITQQQLRSFLLTSAALAVLYKKGASISAAEVGCQGEVGVACSMAAAALTEALGGSVLQVASAAEIGMEHNLGLTCDPINGLVQIPCIERNAIGAVKAVNVARLALLESGENKKVSLDKVIDTMRRTGQDMSTRYKETSQGGLAQIQVNVIEC